MVEPEVFQIAQSLTGLARVKMKDDNTPTVTSRRRKPTPHQRLRLTKVKDSRRRGALAQKKRDEKKKQKDGEKDPEKTASITLRIPKSKTDTLASPAKPPARFRKRQIHKSWLPTHLYHAKRALMTPPKEPLWRFAVPLTPTDKSYRSTYRAAALRGCVAWDTSYMATIGLEGVEKSLIGLLRSIGVQENMLVGKREVKWRRGTRWWEGWIKQRDGEKRWIAKVGIMWQLDVTAAEDSVTQNPGKEAEEAQEAIQGPEIDPKQRAAALQEQGQKRGLKEPKRRLLVRVHPSAFFQTWNEILKVAKIQRPAAMVEDLRFEMGSIEITGPGSTEALIGVLHQAKVHTSTREPTAVETKEDEWVDIESPEQIWPQLVGVTNPASLPPNCILGFNVSDPRLRHPPRTVRFPDSETSNEKLLELIVSWPPDHANDTYDLFDRVKRLTATRKLVSQKAINRRKGDALPGEYPAPSSKDPEIPILLMASRTTTTAGQGSWTLLLPWDCVLPVWYSLMHYPLAAGGNPRFGGLQEKRQIAFEQSIAWYPADYPGTKAGFEWELREREKKKQEWEKRPKGKRTAWESVELGDGNRGEIGLGWACDWERLFQGPPAPSDEKKTQSSEAEKEMMTDKVRTADTSKAPASSTQQPIEPPSPPFTIHHLVAPQLTTSPIPHSALSPVHLTLLTTGHPTRNARIYRLPTTNTELRAKWLALAHPVKPTKHSRPPRSIPAPPKHTAPHQRAQSLAASLLSSPLTITDAEKRPPKAGDPTYPCVPDEADLIGFVTTGNYNLGEGRCEAIGNVAVARVLEEEYRKRKGEERHICIVREAGQSVGRLAKWKFV